MNKKNVLASVVSSLAVLSMISYMFLPPSWAEVPGNVPDLMKKSNELEVLNIGKEDYARDIRALRGEVNELETEKVESDKAADRAQELFDELLDDQGGLGDWSYHIPSMLIEIESLAHELDVEVAIQYETMTSPSQSVSARGEGLQMVRGDVDVRGNYNNVTDYIREMEEIDFISVEELDIKKIPEKYVYEFSYDELDVYLKDSEDLSMNRVLRENSMLYNVNMATSGRLSSIEEIDLYTAELIRDHIRSFGPLLRLSDLNEIHGVGGSEISAIEEEFQGNEDTIMKTLNRLTGYEVTYDEEEDFYTLIDREGDLVMFEDPEDKIHGTYYINIYHLD